MRAILINPLVGTIIEVEYNGDYKHISTLIESNYFDCVRIGDDEGNTIFVDDEGLLNGKVQSTGMFRVDGDYPAYLAGKGLILATDRAGESVATSLDIEALRPRIAFGMPVRMSGRAVFVEGVRAGDTFTPTGRHWNMDI